MMRYVLIALLAAAVTASCGIAQTQQADSSGTVTVLSTGDPIDVFDGKEFLGTTPVTGRVIRTGVHILRYAAHQPGVWRNAAAEETVSVAAGDSIRRTIDPPVLRRISSEPFGASIYSGDSLLGRTPSMLYLGRDVRTLRIVKSGYEQRTLPVLPDSTAIHTVLMPRVDTRTPNGEEILSGANSPGNFPIYASGGIAVLSGIAAAYAKIKADNYYEEYRNTGNPASLSQVHSLDRVSGVSLVISEISISVFTYLLLTR